MQYLHAKPETGCIGCTHSGPIRCTTCTQVLIRKKAFRTAAKTPFLWASQNVSSHHRKVGASARTGNTGNPVVAGIAVNRTKAVFRNGVPS